MQSDQRNGTLSMKRARSKMGNETARPLLVAIVGGSGSGKSWLADRLHSLDDFYLDRSHLPPRRRARLNFDHHPAIDWRSVERVLGALQDGRRASVPNYDFKTHCRKRRDKRFEARPIILMDGLWLLWRPSLCRRFALRIFRDCPARIRLRRRLGRDLRTRGRSAESVRHQFRAANAPALCCAAETMGGYPAERYLPALGSHANQEGPKQGHRQALM
jgi:uridine kinase